MKIKNTTTKFISTLLIIAIIIPTFLFAKPEKAEAFWFATWLTDAATTTTAGSATISAGTGTASLGLQIKDAAKEIARQFLMHIAAKLLQDMTKSTIGWINTGYFKNPLFIENPDSFFKDIAKSEIRDVVSIYGYDTVRFPFGKQFVLNTIDSYNQQLEDNAEYTLSKLTTDPILLNRYRNDFSFGGWNGFLMNTQYPQNNYVGFNLIANEELARRLEGTIQNKAQKVTTTLQQGMGFLSPQTCLSNPDYNNGKNEFKRPSFDPSSVAVSARMPTPQEYGDKGVEDQTETRMAPYLSDPRLPQDFVDATRAQITGEEEDNKRLPSYSPQNPAYLKAMEDWRNNVSGEIAIAKADWDKKNTCTNLVATTPGSVVGNKIMTALGAGQHQTELASAMGNSISAIVDSLLNKFLSKGLNALASKVNPKPVTDDWSYEGRTLGSPVNNNTSEWDTGPDEVIVLADFKKTVDDGINNINIELKLMNNDVPSEPGITQLLSQIWPKARELDFCIPGPDMGWEARILSEVSRNSKALQGKASDDNGEKAAQADLALKELKFASDFFKDWVHNKMLTELPHSVQYMDAVAEIKNLSQEDDELTSAKRTKVQALARLNAIKIGLADISTRLNKIPAQPTEPISGSSEERDLVSLKKQYNATASSVSNTTTIEDTRTSLATLKNKLNTLKSLNQECRVERVEKGWTNNPAGQAHRTSTYLDKGTEQNLFCDFPIKGGYDHESFTHAHDTVGGAVTHPTIPLLNAKDVMNWPRFAGIFGTKRVNINMSCNIIYKANVLDYKGNLPGNTNIVDPIDTTPSDIEAPEGEVAPTADTTGGDLTCNPKGTITVHVGQSISFTATGGDGVYTWAQNDANPATGTGKEWVASWSEPSNEAGKSVQLRDGSGSTGVCTVVVNP